LLLEFGSTTEEGGSAMGAMHRGWVSIKSKLTTYDDKAVLEEAERGEDNAKARYRRRCRRPCRPVRPWSSASPGRDAQPTR
jgi:uncharacterized protein (TIGR02284 family)